MVDLICSTLDSEMNPKHCMRFKRDAFLAILDEEADSTRIKPGLIEELRGEVLARMGGLYAAGCSRISTMPSQSVWPAAFCLDLAHMIQQRRVQTDRKSLG